MNEEAKLKTIQDRQIRTVSDLQILKSSVKQRLDRIEHHMPEAGPPLPPLKEWSGHLYLQENLELASRVEKFLDKANSRFEAWPMRFLISPGYEVEA